MEDLNITCKNCNTKISFCPYCAKALAWEDIEDNQKEAEAVQSITECPSCRKQVSEGVAFCRHCGRKLAGFHESRKNACANCGAELVKDANFCIECGEKIS